MQHPNAVIYDVSGDTFEYHRTNLHGEDSGASETGHIFNNKTKKYVGEISMLSSFVSLIEYPSGKEYIGTDVKSVLTNFCSS